MSVQVYEPSKANYNQRHKIEKRLKSCNIQIDYNEDHHPGRHFRLQFNAADDFLKVISPQSRFWRKPDGKFSQWIFRGMGDSEWDLLPSAFRSNEKAKAFEMPASTYVSQIKKEHAALRNFFRQADRAGIRIPGDQPVLRDVHRLRERMEKFVRQDLNTKCWPFGAWKELTAFAQHHGVPTRLLDWSYSSEVAAFFAMEHPYRESVECLDKGESPKEYINLTDPCVWGLNYVELQAQDGVRLIGAPGATNDYLHAQSGLFTYISDVDAQATCLQANMGQKPPFNPEDYKLEDWVGRLGDRDLTSSGEDIVAMKLELSGNQWPDVLETLIDTGTTYADIYPDASGAADAAIMLQRLNEAKKAWMKANRKSSL